MSVAFKVKAEISHITDLSVFDPVVTGDRSEFSRVFFASHRRHHMKNDGTIIHKEISYSKVIFIV